MIKRNLLLALGLASALFISGLAVAASGGMQILIVLGDLEGIKLEEPRILFFVSDIQIS